MAKHEMIWLLGLSLRYRCEICEQKKKKKNNKISHYEMFYLSLSNYNELLISNVKILKVQNFEKHSRSSIRIFITFISTVHSCELKAKKKKLKKK